MGCRSGLRSATAPGTLMLNPKNSLVVTALYVDVSSKKVIIPVGTPVKDNGRFTAGMFYDLELTNLVNLGQTK